MTEDDEQEEWHETALGQVMIKGSEQNAKENERKKGCEHG